MARDGDALNEARIVLGFAGPRVLLGVAGELNARSAAEVAAAANAMLAPTGRSLVLDLTGVGRVDPAGSRALALLLGKLRARGRRVVIRPPRGQTGDQLVRAGLIDRQALAEETAGLPATPDPGAPARQPADEDELGERVLGRLGAPVVDELQDRAYRLLVAAARLTVAGADGVSVSLRRRGRLTTVAASDERTHSLDSVQYQLGDGPCVSAADTGGIVHVPALAREARWAKFTARALALGIAATFSVPLSTGGRPAGSLNVYSQSSTRLDPGSRRLAVALAEEASAVLTEDADALRPDDPLGGRLAAALRDRETIGLAQGVVMDREGVVAAEAYRMLAQLSRQTGRPLVDIAAAVVESTAREGPVPTAT